MPGDDDNVVRLNAIREAAEAAKELSAIDPPADRPEDGGGDRPPQARRDGLPEDCPILALGRDSGTFYYLDPARQVRTLPSGRHTKGEMQGLFAGRLEYLQDTWPRYAKGTDGQGRPMVNGIQYDKCAMALMQACAIVGIWNPHDKLRGPGWWRGPEGELIAHCGDALAVVTADGDEIWSRPGARGVHVYAAASQRARPVSGPVGTAEADELLELIRSWAWSRPSVAPYLLMGWIGCAMLGAAIDWRPVVWITGGSGTGKSTLKDHLIEPLFGQDGAISVMDATEAGLRQTLKQMSLPAIVDELEAETDNRRVDAIIRLARLAASGGQIRRGGQDHQEVVFELRSAFAFQSILVPPLHPQDRSRLAILDLEPVGDRRAPLVHPDRLFHIGACLRRRLIQAWPRLPATLERHQEAMRAAGGDMAMDARGAAVYGALVGVAELLLYDDPAEAEADFFALPDKLQRQVHAERKDSSEESEFLNHLLSCAVETSRGSQPQTVAELIRRAASTTGDYEEKDRARRVLGLYGLAVVAINPEMPDALGVAIANRHGGLARLLAGTHWTSGAGKSPPWVQLAKRLALAHGGDPAPARGFWFSGFKSRGAWLPLSVFQPEGEGDG